MIIWLTDQYWLNHRIGSEMQNHNPWIIRQNNDSQKLRENREKLTLSEDKLTVSGTKTFCLVTSGVIFKDM